MKKIGYISTICILSIIFLWRCDSKFLIEDQKGVLTEDNIGVKQIEGLVIAAYSFNQGYPEGHYSRTFNDWIFGDIRSDDTYKGGGSLTDQGPWYEMELFSKITSAIGNNNSRWVEAYKGISRVNLALRALNNVDETEFPLKDVRTGEMKFMRAYWHMKCKRVWKWIPYIYENMSYDDIKKEPNHPDGMSSDLPLWDKIKNDLIDAVEALPPVQPEVGRPSKYAAEGLLAYVLMWMAYEQDENHHVVNINKETLGEALVYCNDIISSGQYALQPDFAENFMCEFDNMRQESLWEIQYSLDDGTQYGNINEGSRLNQPSWTKHYGCCDFHKATYNLILAFSTENGLPKFDSFNSIDDDNLFEFSMNYEERLWNQFTFDPRISHTMGIPGRPWKYNNDDNLIFEYSGSRNPAIYGYNPGQKDQVDPTGPCQFERSRNSLNFPVIRYAEILLWKAEILIQLDREDEALPLINQIRERAKNSTGRLIFSDGSPTLYYDISTYEDGVNCSWDKEFAWEAYLWENRLETAMEGRRFFNLIRWGIAEKVINAYFDKEKERFAWIKDGHFQSGIHEYMPIPQEQIGFSEGLYKQNIGY